MDTWEYQLDIYVARRHVEAKKVYFYIQIHDSVSKTWSVYVYVYVHG